jgi:hypothetical protein
MEVFMKTLMILSFALFSFAAQADQLKTYDCVASGSGSVTPDTITVQANSDTLVISFPGRGVDEYSEPSFLRTDKGPAVGPHLEDGFYAQAINSDSFFLGDDAKEHKVNWAWASPGIYDQKKTGHVHFVYENASRSEWSRQYDCSAR